MSFITVIFYFFVVVAALAALGILLVKNVFKGALLLLVCLLSIAALYVMSSAEFVAITQVLIYAGGVIILIIFGIMLTSRLQGEALAVKNSHVAVALIASVLLFGVLLHAIASSIPENAAEITSNTIKQTGINILSDYALPFELAGILLLVVLIGAAITAMPTDKPEKA